MSKSRDIADSAATINYIDTVTSNVQDQIDNIDPLPSQTGNNGLFLTTDGTDASWAAAGGGAWTLIETLSPSAASTIDVESFDSTYEIYKIIYRIDPSTAVLPRILLRFSGAYQTTADYRYISFFISSANGTTYTADRVASGASYIQCSNNTSDTMHYLEIQIHNSNESTGYKNIYFDYRADQSTQALQAIGNGRFHAAAGTGVLEGIRVFPNSGNYTGKVYVYGLTASGA